MLFREHMIQSFGFVFNVIGKLFYTILAFIKFQWIFSISVSELAINAETRWDVLINFFSVWCIWVKVVFFSLA